MYIKIHHSLPLPIPHSSDPCYIVPLTSLPPPQLSFLALVDRQLHKVDVFLTGDERGNTFIMVQVGGWMSGWVVWVGE